MELIAKTTGPITTKFLVRIYFPHFLHPDNVLKSTVIQVSSLPVVRKHHRGQSISAMPLAVCVYLFMYLLAGHVGRASLGTLAHALEGQSMMSARWHQACPYVGINTDRKTLTSSISDIYTVYGI